MQKLKKFTSGASKKVINDELIAQKISETSSLKEFLKEDLVNMEIYMYLQDNHDKGDIEALVTRFIEKSKLLKLDKTIDEQKSNIKKAVFRITIQILFDHAKYTKYNKELKIYNNQEEYIKKLEEYLQKDSDFLESYLIALIKAYRIIEFTFVTKLEPIQ